MIKLEQVKGNFQPIEKIRSLLKEYVGSGRFIREAGQTAVSLIKERTRKGADSSGKPFSPYSAKYRTQNGGGSVDLSKSGQMLDDLAFEVHGPLQGKVTVRGSSVKRVGAHVRGEGNLPKRDFISIFPGSTEEQKLIKLMREKFQRELRRALG